MCTYNQVSDYLSQGPLAQDGLKLLKWLRMTMKLLICSPPPSECCNYRCTALCTVYGIRNYTPGPGHSRQALYQLTYMPRS